LRARQALREQMAMSAPEALTGPPSDRLTASLLEPEASVTEKSER
jgi:hypothetical protein